MKKALTIFGILLMVYSLSTCKVFSSDIRTVTTSTPTTTCPLVTLCRDADGDGYGNPDDSLHGCYPFGFPGYVLDCTDCNDNDPIVHEDCGCQCPDTGLWGCISGQVTKRRTGALLPGKTVILWRVYPGRDFIPRWEKRSKVEETVTDSNGCYNFDMLDYNPWDIWYGVSVRGRRNPHHQLVGIFPSNPYEKVNDVNFKCR